MAFWESQKAEAAAAERSAPPPPKGKVMRRRYRIRSKGFGQNRARIQLGRGWCGMSLISLEQAARMLGYTAKGFRKIVERSRAKAAGYRTHGPTIRFFQATKGSPIKFKVEWIDAFVVQHTVDPNHEAPPTNGASARRPFVDESAGLDHGFLSLPQG